jgi:hypothetical protein
MGARAPTRPKRRFSSRPGQSQALEAYERTLKLAHANGAARLGFERAWRAQPRALEPFHAALFFWYGESLMEYTGVRESDFTARG